MIDAELKQLAERVVLIDSLICKQLGLAWERPTVPFRELPGPIQPRKQTLQCNQRTAGTSLGPKQGGDTESTAKGMYHERTGGQEESDAEVMQLELTMEAVMELLCDETVRFKLISIVVGRFKFFIVATDIFYHNRHGHSLCMHCFDIMG